MHYLQIWNINDIQMFDPFVQMTPYRTKHVV